jgi:hypothetical protein
MQQSYLTGLPMAIRQAVSDVTIRCQISRPANASAKTHGLPPESFSGSCFDWPLLVFPFDSFFADS